jgi:hypothetical protein
MARYEELTVTNLLVEGTLTTESDVTVGNDLTVTGDVVNMANLPIADPSVAGQLYSNGGVVTVSAG